LRDEQREREVGRERQEEEVDFLRVKKLDCRIVSEGQIIKRIAS
jgi:hypothetical protein